MEASDGGRDDLGLVSEVITDGGDVLNESFAVHAGIVKPSHERRDVGGSGFHGQDGLRDGEAKGDVGLDAFVGKDLAGFDAIPSHRKLDDDVLVDLN